jgi:hypothetical protein
MYKTKFIIVAIDYFTKWIEAEAISSITEAQVQKFIWKNLVTRFGLPRVLVFDQGSQFTGLKLQDYLDGLGIKYAHASVCYPQCNGQAEAANKTILGGMRKKMEELDKLGKWSEELPGVLWSLRTTEKEATGRTPFSLVYGTEAVIPIEIMVQSLRLTHWDPQTNEEELKVSLDLLPEARADADAKLNAYHTRIARYYNRSVRHRELQVGDLVLRNASATYQGQELKRTRGKLAPRWEGPYRVEEDHGLGTYSLSFLKNGEWKRLNNKWNIANLRRYYV